MDQKYRIEYFNHKTSRLHNMRCIDKVYKTIKKMESAGQVQILFDERESN